MSWSIAIHGGAGTIARAEMTPERETAYRGALLAALEAGAAILRAGGPAEAAVTAAVLSLEECPLFNAAHGATLTAEGHAECDAALMLGEGMAGAVAGARRIRHPIMAAAAVMRRTPHVLLAGPAADAFAEAEGLAMAGPDWFVTPHRQAQLDAARAAGRVALDHDDGRTGTVGAVACDGHGRLAAATSTGGMTNKRPGRVGDSPVIGAGTWADRQVAVSCTGTGEAFLRCAAAHEVAARMRLAGQGLREATEAVIREAVPAAGGSGGLIAVDAAGGLALPFNTAGMYRAWARAGGAPEAAIF